MYFFFNLSCCNDAIFSHLWAVRNFFTSLTKAHFLKHFVFSSWIVPCGIPWAGDVQRVLESFAVRIHFYTGCSGCLRIDAARDKARKVFWKRFASPNPKNSFMKQENVRFFERKETNDKKYYEQCGQEISWWADTRKKKWYCNFLRNGIGNIDGACFPRFIDIPNVVDILIFFFGDTAYMNRGKLSTPRSSAYWSSALEITLVTTITDQNTRYENRCMI